MSHSFEKAKKYIRSELLKHNMRRLAKTLTITDYCTISV